MVVSGPDKAGCAALQQDCKPLSHSFPYARKMRMCGTCDRATMS